MLCAPTSRPLEQALELRKICQEADIVALHLFPYDIIPILALASECDTVKTLFINHADHTFWVGASVAHSVVHLRRQSPTFLQRRRALRPEFSPILPIPLDYAPSPVARAEAKRALGHAADTVLLLTIASPFKYDAPGQTAFLDLVTPVLTMLPHVALIAVGPEPEGAWLSAGTMTDGRIVALGTRWDNDLLYAAADIYLDSVPFSSTTSLLEAGSRGVPLVGFRGPDTELELLEPGAPGIDHAMELASDAEGYRQLLVRLVRDGDFRQRSGEYVQEQILSLHTGQKWVHTIHDLYTTVEHRTDRGCVVGNQDTFEPSSLNFALIRLYGHTRNQMWFRRLIAKFIGPLPYRTRFPITCRIYLKGFGLCLTNLLPPPADSIVRGCGRVAKEHRPAPRRCLQEAGRKSRKQA